MSKRIPLHKTLAWRVVGLFVTTTLVALFTGGVAVADDTLSRPLATGRTDGYGRDRLLAFTYFLNFMCIHEPGDDLDHNGKATAVDPEEFQSPICQVGHAPTVDPTGTPISETDKLYVIVPFFDADHDGEAGSPALGTALQSLFGMVPDAFDPTPGVPVQCPEPGPPLTEHKGAFGTCTTHPTTLDLGPVLAALNKVPANTTVEVPTPNHSHIIKQSKAGARWWQIIVVLVTDASVWPNVEGTTGLTSLQALRAAQANNQAGPDAPTNFFLVFDATKLSH
jgi:hypothetical protein